VGFDWGTLGVYIFFVLSGFLITGLLIRESEQTGAVSLKGFYIRRLFRIIPPLLFLILGVKILMTLGFSLANNRALLFSLSFLRNYRPGPLVFHHLWSLSVEEQFYLVWPFLFTLLSRRALSRLLTVVILVVPIIRLAAVLWIGDKYVWHTEQVADGLAWGCLLAIKQPELRANRLYQRFRGSYAVAILPCIIIAGAYYYPLSVDALVGKSAIFLCVALGIDVLILRSNSFVGKILNYPPVMWLGRISYSLYLWQQIFLIARPGRYGEFPANLCLSVLCAVVSHYCIERPAIRLGRSFLSRRGRIAAPIDASAIVEPGN
jgi:peptidoglycan/LPS O-acetylase OafA/YrhL